jgi:hypothetical protein
MAEVRPAAERSCAVCGRNLLIGERSNPYVVGGGEEVSVCELCKPRAESAGWMRPDEAAASGGGGVRRRRRGSADLLGGLRARVERVSDNVSGGSTRERTRRERGEPSEGGEEGAERSTRRPSRASRERETRSTEPAPAPTMRSTHGPDVVESLTAFNGSEFRRTVSGLSKSLGEPWATAIAIRTSSGDTGARITVAWELAWYQWEVGPGARRPEVREIARGETIDQLRAADRNWNLDVSRDGTLARRPIGGPVERAEQEAELEPELESEPAELESEPEPAPEPEPASEPEPEPEAGA